MTPAELAPHVTATDPHEYWAPHAGQTGVVAWSFTTDLVSSPNASGETYPLTFRVSVDAVDEEFRGERDALVATLRMGMAAHEAIRDAQRVMREAQERAARADLARRRADSRLDEVLGQTPAGSMIGPAEVRPHSGDDWAGPVWLLDPVKRFAGFGFQFRSIAELWRCHPSLRPVAAGRDEDGPWMRVEVHRHAAEGAK